MAAIIYIAKDKSSGIYGLGASQVAAVNALVEQMYGQGMAVTYPPKHLHNRQCWGVGAYDGHGEFHAIVAYIEARTVEGVAYANKEL